MAETGNAYWLIDTIALMQFEPAVTVQPFHVWTLSVQRGRAGRLVWDDGNRNIIYETVIDYTTFPLDEIRLYFTGNVLLLPSKY